jgi:hypothetical protein
MNSRDEQLLPRLIETLDTIENDHEIAQVVRHVRRITGERAFTRLFQRADTVDLDHPEHDVKVRLRTLGLVLRRVDVLCRYPTIGRVIAQTADALVEGLTVPVRDLLLTLSMLRQFLHDDEEKRARQPDEAIAQFRASQDELRSAMEELHGHLWGRR